MSIYSLGGEGVHGPRPYTVRRQVRLDVRAFVRGLMSGMGWPDVRAIGGGLDAFGTEETGFLGLAGCLG